MFKFIADSIYYPLSFKTRIAIDCGIIGGGLAHMLGWWHTYAGTVASTLGAVWLVMQMSAWVYDRFFKKGK